MNLRIAWTGLFLLLNGWCFAQPEGFETTGNKLFYRHFPSADSGRKVSVGDFLTLQLSYRTENDSVLFDSRKRETPFRMRVAAPDYKGDMMEGYLMLSEGDSASFATSANMFWGKALKRNRPKDIRSGSYLFFEVKVLKVQTAKEVQEEAEALAKAKKASEKSDIADYLQQNNLEAPLRESGLFYLETQKGSGRRVYNGKVVRVHYTGRLLNGKVFDSSYERNQPFQFTVGTGQVIQGWDEALPLMQVGTKALLVIPSALAYGAKGVPRSGIGPYEPLIYEVEVISIM
ncbi:MAG: FKBP-type peptidyl-prolyl cis-trans isomerase [Salibacteraceae bacterium]